MLTKGKKHDITSISEGKMKPIKIKQFLKQGEQERLAFNRRFRRVIQNLSGEGVEPWDLYRDKIAVFVNGKAKKGHKFSSFYCFKERDYTQLNMILNRINQKIENVRKSISRGKKVDKVEDIMRGVIYDVNKNQESECYKANQLYKKYVKKHVKQIFEYFQSKPFDSRECSQLWLQAYREIVCQPEFVDFSDLIKANYLTFNTAFQYIFDYGYFKRHSKASAEEFLDFIHNTYALASNNEYTKYRDCTARIRNGNWLPVSQENISQSIEILTDWFANDYESQKLNPIERACIMHCELVRIQAFPDGNHRLARLIANETLIEADFPSISIDFERRKEYNEATNKAIETHEIDDLIDIYYEQVYKNALKIDRCLDGLVKSLPEDTKKTKKVTDEREKQP